MKLLSKSEKEVIKQRFISIFNAEQQYIMDKQSQSHQLMCAYILAAYESLLVKLNNKETVIIELSEALKGFGGKYIQWSMKIMLWMKRDKRKFIEKAAIEKSKATYGDSFSIEAERYENQFTSVVKKCGYFNFF